MSKQNSSKYTHDDKVVQIRPPQPNNSSSLANITQSSATGTQKRPMPNRRITLAENPTLAKEIQELIDKSHQPAIEWSQSHSPSSVSNGSSIPVHRLPPYVGPYLNDYVPLEWCSRDAEHALAFESALKIALVRFEDFEITNDAIHELSSSVKNVLAQETQQPRFCYVELANYNDADRFLLSRLGPYVTMPANELQLVAAPHEIDPYAITVMNIPEYVSLKYIKSRFMGCLHYNEDYSTHTRKVNFFFRSVIDSTRAYKRAFQLHLGIDRMVCFRRIHPAAVGGIHITAPVAAIVEDVLFATSSDRADDTVAPPPIKRKRANPKSRMECADPPALPVETVAPDPVEAISIKAELLNDTSLPIDAVDVPDDSNTEDDFLQEPTIPEFAAALGQEYHNDFDVQLKNELVDDVVDLTADILGPVIPAKRTTPCTETSVKPEKPPILLGSNLIVNDSEYDTDYSHSDADSELGNDYLYFEETTPATKSQTTTTVETTDVPQALYTIPLVKKEPASVTKPIHTSITYIEDTEIEDFFNDMN